MMRHRESLCTILQKIPHAQAWIKGSAKYPGIQGMAEFYQTDKGVLVVVEVDGLPAGTGACDSPIFALHIHEGSQCSGNAEDAFANVGTHYNPSQCPHPYHAGDLPPLFASNDYALQIFLTKRFRAEEMIGKTIIIHSAPDDFTTQPSGNAGEKIACGEIRSQLLRGRW